MSLFATHYERYIEVFGGGGWVLFHKPPGNDFEVYNDFNGLLVNLYRCVREKPEELMQAPRFVSGRRWHGTAPQVMSSGLHGSIS